jgi:hypothetical protein
MPDNRQAVGFRAMQCGSRCGFSSLVKTRAERLLLRSSDQNIKLMTQSGHRWENAVP